MYISDVYISHHSHTTTPMYRETIGVLSENYASCVAHKHHMMRFIDHLNQIIFETLYTVYGNITIIVDAAEPEKFY